jgi:hypothetical protein
MKKTVKTADQTYKTSNRAKFSMRPVTIAASVLNSSEQYNKRGMDPYRCCQYGTLIPVNFFLQKLIHTSDAEIFPSQKRGVRTLYGISSKEDVEKKGVSILTPMQKSFPVREEVYVPLMGITLPIHKSLWSLVNEADGRHQSSEVARMAASAKPGVGLAAAMDRILCVGKFGES